MDIHISEGDIKKQCSGMWDAFLQKAALSERVSADDIVALFYGLIRTGFVKQINMYFPDGEKDNPFMLTSLYEKFHKYVSDR